MLQIGSAVTSHQILSIQFIANLVHSEHPGHKDVIMAIKHKEKNICLYQKLIFLRRIFPKRTSFNKISLINGLELRLLCV